MFGCGADGLVTWKEDSAKRLRRARQRSKSTMRATQCWWALLALPFGVLRILYLELAPVLFQPFHVSSPRQSAYETSRRTFQMIEAVPQVVLQLLFLSDSSSVDGLVIASIVVCIVHAVSTYQVIVKVNESYPRSTKKILKELFVIGSTEKVLERPYALESKESGN